MNNLNNMNNVNNVNNLNNINNDMNKNIYRLIKPYQSTNVYEAKTTMHGAGKCYRELKKLNVKCDSFSIMNINDNSVYDFKLGQSRMPDMILKNNTNDLLNKNNKNNQNNQIGGADIMTLKTQIDNLTNRIKILEEKILTK